MARSRNIKPGFFQNEDLAEMAYEARLLFIGLWTLADREGRLEYRPKKIKMQLFPGDDIEITRLARCLHDAGMVLIYAVDNVEYLQVVNFHKHQNPHKKEAKSTIPAPEITGLAPDENLASPADSLNLIPDSLNPLPKEKRGGKFIPPTLDELKAYSQEKGLGIDAEQFIDFYQSKGWMVGKNKMKDWRAAARRWARDNAKRASNPYKQFGRTPPGNLEQRARVLNLPAKPGEDYPAWERRIVARERELEHG